MKKKLTEEQKAEITEWFLHEYWPTYPGKWCRGGKGSRQTCLTLMLEKWQPDEPERRRILGNLKAQILHDRKIPDRKWWKICDTYTRNGLWEDEIETIEEPIKQDLSLCITKNCGEPVHGPAYNLCQHCIRRKEDKWQNHRILALKELGLLEEGYTYQQVIESCMAKGSVNGKFSLAHLMNSGFLQMPSIENVNSRPLSTTENSGGAPTGSREWWSEHYPDCPLDYDRETGLEVLAK